MKKIDSQGRLQIPKSLLELANMISVKEVVLVFISGEKYAIVPVDEITSNDKICTGLINVYSNGRMVIPKDIREENEGSMVRIYVKSKRIFIEFEKQK